jgi:small subunit ribosomal protein S13
MAELRQIVRIIDADLPGEKTLYNSLRKVTGVSYSLANAICFVMNFEKEKQVGSLSIEEVKKIEDVIKNPIKYKIPNYLINRRKDYDTGEDMHLVASDLKLTKSFDIKRMSRIKCYKGVRHSRGLPVRGQRTKGHFRHGKTIGVRKKIVEKGGKK